VTGREGRKGQNSWKERMRQEKEETNWMKKEQELDEEGKGKKWNCCRILGRCGG
jgi:hypothetical protein